MVLARRAAPLPAPIMSALIMAIAPASAVNLEYAQRMHLHVQEAVAPALCVVLLALRLNVITMMIVQVFVVSLVFASVREIV